MPLSLTECRTGRLCNGQVYHLAEKRQADAVQKSELYQLYSLLPSAEPQLDVEEQTRHRDVKI